MTRARGLKLLPILSLLGGLSMPALGAGLAVGDPAPAFTLSDTAGTEHSLAQYRGKTVVLEWINPNCPFSRRQAVEGVMVATAQGHPEVVWLAINSTAKGHGDFLEPKAHADWNAKHGIAYPVLYDAEGGVGRAYGARTTPHMFVIDGAGKLVYAGAIDDDPPGRQGKAARRNHVVAALAALAAGRSPDPAATTPYGCSVKYGS